MIHFTVICFSPLNPILRRFVLKFYKYCSLRMPIILDWNKRETSYFAFACYYHSKSCVLPDVEWGNSITDVGNICKKSKYSAEESDLQLPCSYEEAYSVINLGSKV